MMITVEQMVQREVGPNLSYLVTALARGYGSFDGRSGYASAVMDLCEQAFELASPVPDYEEAAVQAGWSESAIETLPNPDGHLLHVDRWTPAGNTLAYATAQECCEEEGIEPLEREVLEHWAVSPWLAVRLRKAGEKVDTDFAGMCVWARTCSGQAIACDGVIKAIHASLIGEA